jgi:hypothetical protein
MTLDEKLGRVETASARWHSRLYRAANMIRKLEAAEKRLRAKIAERQKPKPTGKADFDDPLPDLDQLLAETAADDLGIPTFLQRQKAAETCDRAAAEAIRAEQEERKRNKARVRIEEMKAKQSGATKRMPLQDKEALKAIHSE